MNNRVLADWAAAQTAMGGPEEKALARVGRRFGALGDRRTRKLGSFQWYECTGKVRWKMAPSMLLGTVLAHHNLLNTLNR